MTINVGTRPSREALLAKAKELMTTVDEACKNPDAANESVLMGILEDNKDTEYGRVHGFSFVNGLDDYRRVVPLTTFDDYAEYVYRELEGGETNLMSVYGVNQYNKSSGTMGNPKKIPMSKKTMDLLMGYLYLYSGARAYARFGDAIFQGKVLSVAEASSVQEIGGKTYVGVSAQAILRVVHAFPEVFTSPMEATIPAPDTNSRYLHARYGLAEKNVTILYTTFSTFLLDMFHYIEGNWEMICNDIENGTIDPSVRMSADVRSKLEAELQPMPARAEELRAIFREGFHPGIVRKIWPNILFMYSVCTGTFSAYLKHLQERYTGDLPSLCTGLTASEGSFTIPFEFDNPLTIPSVGTAFLEFLPLGEDDQTKTLTLEQLELGGEYELIVTTHSGLYRYRTRDALRVKGFRDRMPEFEYMHRIDMCINLNGEKTYEPALRKAMDDTAAELGFTYLDFCVYPNTDVVPSCYSFFIEKTFFPDGISMKELSECLQRHLIEANPLLAYKFERNLIGPVTTCILQDQTYLLYRDKLILKGGASTQVKPVKIIMNEAQLRFFRVLVDKDYS